MLLYLWKDNAEFEEAFKAGDNLELSEASIIQKKNRALKKVSDNAEFEGAFKSGDNLELPEASISPKKPCPF